MIPPWRRRLLLLFRLIFGVMVIFTLLMILWPGHPGFTPSFATRFGDIVAFLLLAASALLAFPAMKLPRLGLLLSLIAAVLEGLQAFVGRHNSIVDWMIETAMIILLLALSPSMPERDRIA